MPHIMWSSLWYHAQMPEINWALSDNSVSSKQNCFVYEFTCNRPDTAKNIFKKKK